MRVLEKIPEKEIIEALLNEYKRKLILYRLTDERLQNKYKMNFATFENSHIVKKKGYSWEVEKDSMEWEHAIDGIKTYLKKIQELEKLL